MKWNTKRVLVLIPVRRHVWRWTSERERDKSVFWRCFNARAQRFPRQRNWTRMCECGHPTSDSCKSRNCWVSSHTSNFSTIGHSDPETRRWGCTCARAEMPHPTHDLWKAPSSWPPTHTPKLNSIGQAVPEIQKCGLHVRTCRDTQPMTCGKHLDNDSKPAHQIWTQSSELFVRYRSAVCTCALAEIPHPWLLLKL